MRKYDWCREDSTCRGIACSECVVRGYKDFVVGDKPRQTVCCFCGKELLKDRRSVEIRGGLGNSILAKLCEDCYEKYIRLKSGISIFKEDET